MDLCVVSPSDTVNTNGKVNSKNCILNIFTLFLFVYRSCNDKSITLKNFTLFATIFLTKDNVMNRIVTLRHPYINLCVYGEGIDNYRTENTLSTRRISGPKCYCNAFRTISPSDRWNPSIIIAAFSKVNDVPPQRFTRSRHMCY